MFKGFALNFTLTLSSSSSRFIFWLATMKSFLKQSNFFSMCYWNMSICRIRCYSYRIQLQNQFGRTFIDLERCLCCTRGVAGCCGASMFYSGLGLLEVCGSIELWLWQPPRFMILGCSQSVRFKFSFRENYTAGMPFFSYGSRKGPSCACVRLLAKLACLRITPREVRIMKQLGSSFLMPFF